MKKVLVTGSNGFVGFYIVKHLLQKGFPVIATGKGEKRFSQHDCDCIYETLDFTNRENVSRLFQKHRPHLVVHSGAMSKPDDCELNRENAFLTNVTGTMNLLAEAAEIKASFLFLSTDFVFRGDKGMYAEEDERQPVNFYGETKMLAEDQVMQYRYNWAIVRTVLVYGKPPVGGRGNLVTNTAAALQKGEQLKIFNDQLRTPTYVEDLAAAITALAEQDRTGIFHVSGEDKRTPFEMAMETAQFLGLDSSLVSAVTEADFQQPARRPLKTGFNISKVKQELGFQPISFSEGLKKTFESG